MADTLQGAAGVTHGSAPTPAAPDPDARPTSARPTNASEADVESKAEPALIWPPPAAEIEAWEVIELPPPTQQEPGAPAAEHADPWPMLPLEETDDLPGLPRPTGVPGAMARARARLREGLRRLVSRKPASEIEAVERNEAGEFRGPSSERHPDDSVREPVIWGAPDEPLERAAEAVSAPPGPEARPAVEPEQPEPAAAKPAEAPTEPPAAPQRDRPLREVPVILPPRQAEPAGPVVKPRREPPPETPPKPEIRAPVVSPGAPTASGRAVSARPAPRFDARAARTGRAASTSSPSVPRAGMRRGLHRSVLVALLAGAVAVGFGLATLARRGSSAGPSPARLSVESSPSGAVVRVDGVPRGETPLRLDLPEGEYRLEVESPAGRHAMTLTLVAGADVSRHIDFTQAGATGGPLSGGDTARGDVPAAAAVAPQPPGDVATPREPRPRARRPAPPPAAAATETGPQSAVASAGVRATLGSESAPAPVEGGWMEVRAPVALRVLEGGRSLGTTEGGRLALSAGQHALEFVNDDFEVRIARTVTVEPGRGLAVDLDLRGRVSLNAEPWAEVWLGNQRLGETPLGNVSLPVGRHEFVFRHPELGERRAWGIVRGASTTRLSVSFTR